MESIEVCLRLRPKTTNEDTFWKAEGHSIMSLKSKEVFAFDKIIHQEETNESMFRSSVKDKVESFLRGINVSIFAYGQTSTGKTFTMKGSNSNLNGIIPMALKEILGRLKEDKVRWVLKASYLEIYNETVNDLLDKDKKNLEIRESLQRGVFVNNITEIPIDSFEKGINLLKQGDTVRVIAETKLNEKSSRSHSIFKLNLEVTRQVDSATKTFTSQLNLIDLAGSENVSKAKTEGIRMKEGSNINKSLLALSNVIAKLSKDSKSFVNYRDSKLTRLLQPALAGNSKTMVICTITDNVANYAETLNTLHFGLKARNVKTAIKVNEVTDEKTKIMKENTQLKTKIKELEDMIHEKNPPGTNTETISSLEKEVMLLKKILLQNEEVGESDFISVNNENMSVGTKDNNAHSDYGMGGCSNNYANQNNYNSSNNLFNYNAPSYTGNMMSASKQSNKHFMSSGKKMTDSARKMKDDYFDVLGGSREVNFRRSMTDMKNSSFAPGVFASSSGINSGINNYLLNTASKRMGYTSSAYKANSHMGPLHSVSHSSIPNFSQGMDDADFLYPGQNDSSFQLLKENDELRKNLYDLRKSFLETVQSKDNQIRSLNYFVNSTNENCEKIIREAEENYHNLKLDFNRTREDVQNKDTEIKNLNQTIRSLEANCNFYKEEINNLKIEIQRTNDSLKGDKAYRELEQKYREVDKSYETLVHIYESEKKTLNELKTQNEKFRSENGNTKMNLDNSRSENLSLTTQYEVMKKNLEIFMNETSKLKNDIESYKHEVAAYKDKVNRLTKDKKLSGQGELENRVSQQTKLILCLEAEVKEYKDNLIKIEQGQIVEYQKLLDESFNKISELQNELELSQEKNVYLEKVVTLKSAVREHPQTETKSTKETPLKPLEVNLASNKINKSGKVKDPQISQFSLVATPSMTLKDDNLDNGIEDEASNSNGKDFIGKKRKYLNRVYQNILDKNLTRSAEMVI